MRVISACHMQQPAGMQLKGECTAGRHHIWAPMHMSSTHLRSILIRLVYALLHLIIASVVVTQMDARKSTDVNNRSRCETTHDTRQIT